MSTARHPERELTFFALATVLLSQRTRITRWTLYGAIVAALLVARKPALYSSSVSFITQAADGPRSSLASLAGQFGVSLPAAGSSFSPELYVKLLNSHTLLVNVVRDTLVVTEEGGRRATFLDLAQVDPGRAAVREEQGIKLLKAMMSSSVVKSTGVVELTVQSKWPSVSLGLTRALLSEVNAFNRRTSQSQAEAERRFVDERVREAAADLRASEDRLAGFLTSNRQYTGSPELTFQRERLQREVAFKQQVVTMLAQSLEEASIRAVRDMPAITVIDAPVLAVEPAARGRVKSVVLGALLGACLGMLLIFVAETVMRRTAEGDSEVTQFVNAFQDAMGGLLRPFRALLPRLRG